MMFKQDWENKLQEIMNSDAVFSQIVPMDYTPLTRWQKVKIKLRHLKAYLTRYKIVDTWNDDY